MSTLRRSRLLSETHRRLLTAGSVALVLVLSVLGSSPELHRLIHGGADAGHEDGCAIMLFAHGVSAPSDTAVPDATPETWVALSRPETIEIFLTSPRYRLQPERGPPGN